MDINVITFSKPDRIVSSTETLPGGWGGGGRTMSFVSILKCLMSVYISASYLCRKLKENSLSLSEFKKRGIALPYKETITVLH